MGGDEVDKCGGFARNAVVEFVDFVDAFGSVYNWKVVIGLALLVVDKGEYRNQEAPHTCSSDFIKSGSMTRSLALSGIEHRIFCSFSWAICRKPCSFVSRL